MAWKAVELDAHAKWLDEEMAKRAPQTPVEDDETVDLETRLQFRDPELVEQYAERLAFH